MTSKSMYVRLMYIIIFIGFNGLFEYRKRLFEIWVVRTSIIFAIVGNNRTNYACAYDRSINCDVKSGQIKEKKINKKNRNLFWWTWNAYRYNMMTSAMVMYGNTVGILYTIIYYISIMIRRVLLLLSSHVVLNNICKRRPWPRVYIVRIWESRFNVN